MTTLAQLIGVPSRWLLLCLVAFAMTRGGCLGLVKYRFDAGDAMTYLLTAKTLRTQGTYSLDLQAPFTPTAYRPPGYTAFLAKVSTLAGDSPLAAQTAQILLSVCTLLLLTAVAFRLAPGTQAWVLGIAALNPFDAVYAGALLSESLTTFLLTVTIASLVLLKRARLVAIGISFGLLCLTRDIYLALLPFCAAAWVVWGHQGAWPSRAKAAALVGVIAGCIIAPYTVRNAVHFGKFIPISAGRLGLSLWVGAWATNADFTQADALGEARVWPAEAFLTDDERPQVQAAFDNIAESDPIFRALFFKRFRAQPAGVVATWFKRLPKLWLGTRFDIFDFQPTLLPRGSKLWAVVKASLYALNALLLAAALVGLALAFRKRAPVAWAAVPLAFTTLVYLPLNSFENRYSQPMLPLLALLGAFAAHEIRLAFEQRRLRLAAGAP